MRRPGRSRWRASGCRSWCWLPPCWTPAPTDEPWATLPFAACTLTRNDKSRSCWLQCWGRCLRHRGQVLERGAAAPWVTALANAAILSPLATAPWCVPGGLVTTLLDRGLVVDPTQWNSLSTVAVEERFPRGRCSQTRRSSPDRPGPNCGGRLAARLRRNQNTNRNNTSSTAMTKAMMAIIRVFTGPPI